MAIRALKLSSTVRFVSPSDSAYVEGATVDAMAQNGATVFVVSPLDSRAKAYVDDLVSEFVQEQQTGDQKVAKKDQAAPDARVRVHMNEAAYVRCQFALKDLINFQDPETGEPVPYETRATQKRGKIYKLVKEEIVDRIPLDVLIEVSNKVEEISSPAENDAKNSATSSSQSTSSRSETAAPVPSSSSSAATPAS